MKYILLLLPLVLVGCARLEYNVQDYPPYDPLFKGDRNNTYVTAAMFEPGATLNDWGRSNRY